jgi:hypothetical protein
MCGIKKNNKQEIIYSTFLTGCCLPYCTCCLLSCLVYIYVSFKVLVCIVVSWIACKVTAVLYILWSPYVYLLYSVFVSEGPATSTSTQVFLGFPVSLSKC